MIFVEFEICVPLISTGHDLFHALLKLQNFSIDLELFPLKQGMVNLSHMLLIFGLNPLFESAHLVNNPHIIVHC